MSGDFFLPPPPVFVCSRLEGGDMCPEPAWTLVRNSFPILTSSFAGVNIENKPSSASDNTVDTLLGRIMALA